VRGGATGDQRCGVEGVFNGDLSLVLVEWYTRGSIRYRVEGGEARERTKRALFLVKAD